MRLQSTVLKTLNNEDVSHRILHIMPAIYYYSCVELSGSGKTVIYLHLWYIAMEYACRSRKQTNANYAKTKSKI